MCWICVHNSCVHFKYVELLSVRRKCRTFPISQRVVCVKKAPICFMVVVICTLPSIKSIIEFEMCKHCSHTHLPNEIDFEIFRWPTKKVGIVVCSKRAIVVCKQFVYIFGAVIKGRRLQSSLSAVIRNGHFCVFMLHIYTRPDTNKSQFLLLFWHL